MRSDTRGLSEGLAVAISAVVGVVVAIVLTWLANSWYDAFFEQIFRVGPTVKGGGVGADWVAGNTEPLLNLLISLTHAADVLMGLFILLMVFIHWGVFRRMADRMRTPREVVHRGEETATDGGKQQ